MEKIVVAALSLVLLAGSPAVAQEGKKGMGMKHDKMHEKMQEKMKDKHRAGKRDAPAKKDQPAKKDEHNH
jgi:hypothetical protein